MVAQMLVGDSHFMRVHRLLIQRQTTLLDEELPYQYQLLILVLKRLLDIPVVTELVFYVSVDAHRSLRNLTINQ